MTGQNNWLKNWPNIWLQNWPTKMKVICAGLMKTGTKSHAKALRQLGFLVYDAEEHFSFHLQSWYAILGEAKEPDFLSMYRDVDAVTDAPASIFYEEILKAFPDAKVILSERDSEDVWLASWIKQTEILLSIGREPLNVLLLALSSSFRKSWKNALITFDAVCPWYSQL